MKGQLQSRARPGEFYSAQRFRIWTLAVDKLISGVALRLKCAANVLQLAEKAQAVPFINRVLQLI